MMMITKKYKENCLCLHLMFLELNSIEQTSDMNLKVHGFLIHILIKYILQFILQVVFLNIMIVGCVLCHLNMYHVLMLIRKMTDT